MISLSNASNMWNPAFNLDPVETSDLMGITDSKKSQRAYNELKKGQSSANSQLDADTSNQMGMLTDAMTGRTLGQNLDKYDSSIANAQSKTNMAGDLALSQQNAGSSDNVTNYLNPQMDMMLGNTMQRMQGSAGSALQSSAATKSAANAVSQQAGNLWQQAFNNAISDSQNNQQVANQYQQNAQQNAQLAGVQLEADNAPAEDYLQLANDKAMQRYAGNIALTQAGANLAGQDRSFLHNLLGG